MAAFIFLFVRDLETEAKKNSYVVTFDQSMCPANGWIDCMPTVDETRSFMCEEEFLAWAKTNCSNFQGAAL